MLDDLIKPAIQVDPLGCKAIAHAWNAWNVVSGFAAERRQIRVLFRGDMVFLHHRIGSHMFQVFEMMPRIQHGDVVVDELERVTVSGQYQRAIASFVSHARQRADHVITLISGFFDERDAQRIKHLLNQRQLRKQIFRSRISRAFILRQHRIAERAAFDVESDGKMIGMLSIDHLRKHGGETPDGIGCLTCGCTEILYGQGKKSAERQGMAVNDQ